MLERERLIEQFRQIGTGERMDIFKPFARWALVIFSSLLLATPIVILIPNAFKTMYFGVCNSMESVSSLSNFIELIILCITIILYALTIYDFCRIFVEGERGKEVLLIARIVFQAVLLQFIMLMPSFEKVSTSELENESAIGLTQKVLLYIAIAIFLGAVYIVTPMLQRFSERSSEESMEEDE